MKNIQKSNTYNLDYLKTSLKSTIFQNFYFYNEIDSTMNQIKRFNQSQKKEGTIVNLSLFK